MDLPERLSVKDVRELEPLQMESLILPLDKKLADIRKSLVGRLEYVNNDFASTIKAVALVDLYDTLISTNHLYLLDIIGENTERLSVLSANYKLLYNWLEHYNEHVKWLDNVFFRRGFLKNIPLN